MPRRGGGKRRKRRTHAVPPPGTGPDKSIPRVLVFRRGRTPAALRDLVPDIRRLFMPNTALNLKERRNNSIKDYLSVSSSFGISHFWIFSCTDRAPHLRFSRIPHGPTLTLRVEEYSLAKDVRSIQRRPVTLQESDFTHAPLLVLNNLAVSDGCEPDKTRSLMAEMFRQSFPAVDVKKTRLRDMKRVVLVDRDADEDVVRIRQYAVRVQAAGLSKSVRKIIVRGKVPKLAKMTDVSELLDGDGAYGAFSSDSEVDDTPMPVTLPQTVKKLRRGANSTVRLVEVGPRLTLRLVKIQEGLCDGAVLYHRFIEKDKNEVLETERRIKEREALKRKRREEQDANVERKQSVKRAKKERYKERQRMRQENGSENRSENRDNAGSALNSDDDMTSDSAEAETKAAQFDSPESENDADGEDSS